MRRLRIAVIVICCAVAAPAQSFRSPQHVSPNEQFRRGMNAFAGTVSGRSDSDAVSEIRHSAESGYAPAQTVVGYLYENGISFNQSPSQAVDWYSKAARQGDAVAQYALGRAYYLGFGVRVDKTEAQKWLKAASEQGNPSAHYLLGKLLEPGDPGEAAKQYRAAAQQGIPLAQYRLGLLLKDGHGLATDPAEAYAWLSLSLEAGVKAAELPVHELEAKLGEAAKQKAQELESSSVRSANANGCDGWSGEFDEVPTVPPPDIQKYCR